MSKASEWLDSIGRKYLSKLSDANPVFLGELEVSDEEVSELFRRIKLVADPCWPESVRACTAIAAVQAAVYASEQHPGYIEVFFERLGTEIDQARWNREFGPAILRFLEERFEEVDRPGGFRFVRPILNQAGISFRALPGFARFVKSLLESSGPGFTASEYEAALGRVTSRFVKRFLTEGSGLNFTRDVVRTLERIESGSIDRASIPSIQGYRRGFWNDLLSHLEVAGHCAGSAPTRYADPYEFLDLDSCRLMVRYDDAGIAARAYLQGARPVNFSVAKILGRASIEGSTLQPDGRWTRWKIQPWTPGCGDWALFRASDGRLVASDDSEMAVVAAGEYILAVNDELASPVNAIEQGSYIEWEPGKLPVPLYCTWRVSLSAGEQAPGLAVRVTGTCVPQLAFPKGVYKCPSGVHVFVQERPVLSVAPWSEDTARQYVVMVQENRHSKPKAAVIEGGKIRLDVTIPGRGRAWVEPRGRVRHELESLPNVEYIVLPCPFSFSVPGGPYRLDEDVPAVLVCDQRIAVEWACQVRPQGEQTWKILRGQRVAEGAVVFGEVRVPFAFRLPRCELNVPAIATGLPVIWLPLEAPLKIRIEAPPRSRVELKLRDEKGEWRLWTLPTNVPDSGIAYCSSDEFRDYLQSFTFPVSELGTSYTHAQGTAWSGLFIASANKISAQLNATGPTWQGFNIPILGPMLRIVRDLYDTPLRQEVEVEKEVLSSPLASWIANAILLAYSLDRVAATAKSEERLKRIASPEILNLVEILRALDSGLVGATGGALGPDLIPDCSLIPIPRLRAIAEVLVGRIKEAADLPAMLAEWRKEVSDTTAPPSTITQLSGGGELTRCSRFYLRGFQANSSSVSMRLYNAAISGLLLARKRPADAIVASLQAAIYLLALLRSERREQCASFEIPEVPGVFCRMHAQMRDIVALSAGQPVTGNWPEGLGLEQVSPVDVDGDIATTADALATL